MSQRPYTVAFLRGVHTTYERLGRNTHALARALGKPRSTCRHILRQVAARGVADVPRPGVSPTPPRPRFTVRIDAPRRGGAKLRIVCIGDAHDSPALPDKSRFTWIGRYIRAVKPDVVVQIGDFLTLDSLSPHGGPATAFIDDMASFNRALEALDISGPARHCTLGNHEDRLTRDEASAPHTAGLMSNALQDIFRRHGWTVSPYGQVTLYGGVGFAHTVLNRMGQPYGGKCAAQAIADDALHDLVLGHSHVRLSHRAPKLGGNNFIQVFNVGCALPQGHVEPYARHLLTGWSYGISDLTIRDGHVQDESFVSMTQLAERYGGPRHGHAKA